MSITTEITEIQEILTSSLSTVCVLVSEFTGKYLRECAQFYVSDGKARQGDAAPVRNVAKSLVSGGMPGITGV
jgi:hypothetical protein